MNYRTNIFLFTLIFFQLTSISYGGQTNSAIDTQVVRVLATKKEAYYHKPWKSPNFETVAASGFFFKDSKDFPRMKGLILTNAHVVAMAQSIKISNGREKRR
ncbi:MAG: hypothetical protein P8017_00225, partial [Deltaproteobacteria bacterium]